MCLLLPRIKEANPRKPSFFSTRTVVRVLPTGMQAGEVLFDCEFLIAMEDSLTHSIHV